MFRTKLGYSSFSALPDAFFKDPKGFAQKPVTNGPFKFVQWDHNSQIIVEANPDYPGPEKPKVKKIVYKMYKDDNAAYADLVSNNLDFTELIPPSALAGDKWKTDLGDRAIDGQQGVIQTITFPLYDKEFGGNADFRKAVSYAIDRKTITDKIFNKGRVPINGWVSPIVEGFKDEPAATCAPTTPPRRRSTSPRPRPRVTPRRPSSRSGPTPTALTRSGSRPRSTASTRPSAPTPA